MENDSILDRVSADILALRPTRPVGQVVDVTGGQLRLGGLNTAASLGDRLEVRSGQRRIQAEVIGIDIDRLIALPEGPLDGVARGTPVVLTGRPRFAPHDGWIGRVVDPDGQPLDGRPLLPGVRARRLTAAPPDPHARRGLGDRLETGMAVFNTLLPLASGQRMGLFAGSGVGKSTLLGRLARGVEADVIVIGLVGERGREVRDFVQNVLGPEGMARTVVIAATSDRAANVRRRCAQAATTVAEHFRDQGQHVLLLIDSITRFCEAHREISVAAGEPANLRGYPSSTAATIAALCERAGPGDGTMGDITALFTVLVAGSDMEEPVADMLRGVLDGHVVLDRGIAEGGRFPAVDVLRSVSRSLPGVASENENTVISDARASFAAYDRVALMLQAGLYQPGSDPAVDQAIAAHDALEQFLALQDGRDARAHFAALRLALNHGAPKD